jgi:hypothetical protein
MSGIPVAGVGGLGLVAMAAWIAIVMPEIRGTVVAGLAGGVVLAVVLVLARRYSKAHGPSGDDPKILFRDLPPEAGSRVVAHRERRAVDRELMVAGSPM